MREVGCGVVVPPGRPDVLARAIRELPTTAGSELVEMGRRGRELRRAPRPTARWPSLRYRDVLERCCGLLLAEGALLGLARARSSGRMRLSGRRRGALARVGRGPCAGEDALPSVTVIVAAHDEETVIERRVENLLALDYPADRLRDRRHLGRLRPIAPRSSPRLGGRARRPQPARRQGRGPGPRRARDATARSSPSRTRTRPGRPTRCGSSSAHFADPDVAVRLRAAGARGRRRLEPGGRLLALRDLRCGTPSRGSARSPAATARSTRSAAPTTSRSTRASVTTCRCPT